MIESWSFGEVTKRRIRQRRAAQFQRRQFGKFSQSRKPAASNAWREKFELMQTVESPKMLETSIRDPSLRADRQLIQRENLAHMLHTGVGDLFGIQSQSSQSKIRQQC